MNRYISLFLIVFVQGILSVDAGVTLPAIFGDHMVLQQSSEVKLWGWSNSSEEVKVATSWNNVELVTKGSNQGKWEVILQTPKAGGPYTISIKGYNQVVIEDVLIGEVWLCSGQSNMEWTPSSGIDNGEELITGANQPQIRLFNVAHITAQYPQIDLQGEWVVCTPETMKYFSAIGYVFGKELNSKLNVPVGLINSSWGGTPAEAWTSEEVIRNDKNLNAVANKMKPVPWGPTEPGRLFNAMIIPLIPYKIAGTIWYQGEGNVEFPGNYEPLLTTMINNWRDEWGFEFPFYFIQIAPYKYGRPIEGAYLRDSQRKVLAVPNTGMVVVSDIGNVDDIHPRNKIDVGIRLANLALNKTYGKKDIVCSGPLYKEIKIEKKAARIYFDYAEGGLKCKSKSVGDFLIAGEDKVFYEADAKIDGNTVIVSSKKVKKPVAVRFAWNNIAEPDLTNKEGLPTSTFRTDEWEVKFE